MKKKIVLSLIFLFFCYQIFAQNKEGVVIYECKRNMHSRIDKENEHLKSMIPEFSISKNELKFNENQSLFVPLDDEDNEEDNEGGKIGFKIKNMGGETYIDYQQKKVTSYKNIGVKEFLVEDTLKNFLWKLSSQETIKIQNYNCKKAILTGTDEKKITAWYTEDLTANIIPEAFYGLPGAILKLSIGDDEIVYEAKSIIFKKLNKKDIQKPNKGKKLTNEEFINEVKKIFPEGTKGGVKMMKR